MFAVICRSFLPAAFLFALMAATGPARAGDETSLISALTESGPQVWRVEIASDGRSRQVGLMNRRLLAAKSGMLFDFGESREVAMWMKNTYIPLDMVFIRKDGSIARIAGNTVPHSTDIIVSGEPVRYVLEINAGEARATGLKPGISLKHPLFSGN